MKEKKLLDEVKYEKGKLIVPTPKGDIIVSVEDDYNYPGVYVDFKSKDIKESALTYDNDEIQLARIEYDIVNRELRTYLWETPGEESYSYKATYNDYLMFNEDFEILPQGTKVIHNDKLGYIIKDNRDECNDGYKESLKYAIKYALNGESYEDVLERINSSDNEKPYDVMIFWRNINEIKYLEMNTLKDNLYQEDMINRVMDKLLDCYDKETIKRFNTNRMNEELVETLCFSCSSVLANFIEDNKFYFSKYAYDHSLSLDKYIDKFITSDAKVFPFIDKEPLEFFNLLKEYGENILAKI